MDAPVRHVSPVASSINKAPISATASIIQQLKCNTHFIFMKITKQNINNIDIGECPPDLRTFRSQAFALPDTEATSARPFKVSVGREDVPSRALRIHGNHGSVHRCEFPLLRSNRCLDQSGAGGETLISTSSSEFILI